MKTEIQELYSEIYEDLLLAGFVLTEHEIKEFRKIIEQGID